MTVPIDIAELRFRRDVERLHGLGPRALAEFLDELGAERLLRSEIEQKVRRYAGISQGTLKAVGGDRFASALWSVRRR